MAKVGGTIVPNDIYCVDIITMKLVISKIKITLFVITIHPKAFTYFSQVLLYTFLKRILFLW